MDGLERKVLTKIISPTQNIFIKMLKPKAKKKNKTVEYNSMEKPTIYNFIKKPKKPDFCHHAILEQYQKYFTRSNSRYRKLYEFNPDKYEEDYIKCRKVNIKYIQSLFKKYTKPSIDAFFADDYCKRNIKKICDQNFHSSIILVNTLEKRKQKQKYIENVSKMEKELLTRILCLPSQIEALQKFAKESKLRKTKLNNYFNVDKNYYTQVQLANFEEERGVMFQNFANQFLKYVDSCLKEIEKPQKNTKDLENQIRLQYLQPYFEQNQQKQDKLTNQIFMEETDHDYSFDDETNYHRIEKAFGKKPISKSRNTSQNKDLPKNNQKRNSIIFQRVNENLMTREDQKVKKQSRNKFGDNLSESKRKQLVNYMNQKTSSNINLDSYAYQKSKPKIYPRQIRRINQITHRSNRAEPQKLSKKKKFQYPFKIERLVVESEKQSYLLYKYNEINIKEVTVMFLTDRRKFSENNVKIALPPKSIMTKEEESQAMQIVQILNALGAVCWIDEEKPYRQYNQIYGIQFSMVSFLVGCNMKEIIEKYEKMVNLKK